MTTSISTPLPIEIYSATPDHIVASQYYLDILEKTNQQLSLWYSPHALSVSILTLLVAFLAIFFAYILWKQGREYRLAFEEFLQEQKKVANQEIEKLKLEAHETITQAIAETSKTLDSVQGDARAKIENQIKELKKLGKELEDNHNSNNYIISNISGSYGRSVFVGGTARRGGGGGSYVNTNGISPYSRRFRSGTLNQDDIESLRTRIEELENRQKN